MLEKFHVAKEDIIHIEEERLRSVTKEILMTQDISEKDALLATDALIKADLRGVESHGVSNMLRAYLGAFKSNSLNPKPNWKIVKETASCATINSDNGLGIVVAPQAMEIAVEKAKKCTLLLKTEAVFEHGTDLPAVVDSMCDPEIHKVKFDPQKWSQKQLNYLYNCSDAHMFMTDNEGWGLGLTESLTAGRMIIAPVQGGMQDQMRFEDENGDWINFSTEHPSNADGKYKKCGEWAMPIFPKTRSVKGSPLTPYIFASQCSIEDAAIALMKVYKMGPEERQRRGLAGREWVLSDESGFTAKAMGQGFIDNINNLLEEWEPQPRFTVTKVDDSTKLDNYNPNPISLTPEFIKEIQSI